jgi:hypothetical protein
MLILKTELELLDFLIHADFKTKVNFCEKIEMSRQNLNYLMRNSKKANGILPKEFKTRLKGYGIDLYGYVAKPTNDTHENAYLQHVAEGPTVYSKDSKIVELLERNVMLLTEKCKDLEEKLRAVQAENAELKDKLNLPRKKRG